MMAGQLEQAIHFDAGGVLLEGRLGLTEIPRAAVIAHPHPLYGGDMDNPVVGAIARAYAEKGWGPPCGSISEEPAAAEGNYEEGTGEQTDVQAAIALLQQAGCHTIELAGYSFGAWVLAQWAANSAGHPHRLRFVAPPVAFMDFGGFNRISGLAQVIVGGNDDIAPSKAVAAQLGVWAPDADFQIIEAADHFFWHQMGGITEALRRHIHLGQRRGHPAAHGSQTSVCPDSV
jgi:alpha/beta superfamily hydrolase